VRKCDTGKAEYRNEKAIAAPDQHHRSFHLQYLACDVRSIASAIFIVAIAYGKKIRWGLRPHTPNGNPFLRCRASAVKA
jgi:hypothetical protein